MIPGPRGRELALVAALLALLAPFVWSSAWREDELSQLANALRLLTGDVLYRDFLEILTPLSLWLGAGIFAVTGPSLLAARVVLAVAVAASGWLVARLVRVLGGGEAAAWLAAFAVVLAAFRPFPAWNHHWIALPLALGAAWLAVTRLEAPRAKGWVAAGGLAAACLMTSQSDGLAVTAGLGLALGLAAALGAWRPADAGQALGRLALGYGAVLGAVVLVLVLQGTLDDAWRCAWEWPRAHYQRPGGVNDLLFAHDLGTLLSPQHGPWPGRLGFLARVYHVGFAFAALVGTAVALLAWALGLAWRALRAGAPATPAEARWGLVGVLALAYAALAVRGRADYIHLAFYLPWVLVPLAAAADRLRPHLRPAGPVLPWLPMAGLAAFVATGGIALAAEMRAYPAAWLSPRSPDAVLAGSEVVRYIRAHTTPTDRIIALPQGSLPYFHGRPSAGDMNVMLPPRLKYTDEADYDALWRRIAERRPALILVTPDHGLAAELPLHLRRPLPDYEQAAVVETPTYPRPRKTWVLRRKPGS